MDRPTDPPTALDSGANPTGLRVVPGGRPEPGQGEAVGLPSTIAVASGKGGVGKTSVTVNLSLALAGLRRRVVVVDGDLGLGQVDLLIGSNPVWDLGHVLEGRCRPEEALTLGPGGVRFLLGPCGRGDLVDLDGPGRERLAQAITRCQSRADLVLLDLASGIGANPVEMALQADRVLIVTNPEPTALTDAYAFLKVLLARGGSVPRIVMNRVRSSEEALDAFGDLAETAFRHLGIRPAFLGSIPESPVVPRAIRRQSPFLLDDPEAPVSRDIREIARRLADPTDSPWGGPRDRAPRPSSSPRTPGTLASPLTRYTTRTAA